jgi:excisionase family DNA binding protein
MKAHQKIERSNVHEIGEEGNMEKLLTVKQAADLLGCSEAGIRKWVYQRRLPVVRVGRLVRVRATDLETFVEAGCKHLT